MNPLNKTLNEARMFKMANDIDSLAKETNSQLKSKFDELEGVLVEVKDTNKEVKELSGEVKLTLKSLDTKFEEHTNEIVDVIKEIKATGLK